MIPVACSACVFFQWGITNPIASKYFNFSKVFSSDFIIFPKFSKHVHHVFLHPPQTQTRPCACTTALGAPSFEPREASRWPSVPRRNTSPPAWPQCWTWTQGEKISLTKIRVFLKRWIWWFLWNKMLLSELSWWPTGDKILMKIPYVDLINDF